MVLFNIIPASYQFSSSNGQVGVAPAIPIIILYGVIAVGIVFIILKALDVLKDHLALADAKDKRRLQEKIIDLRKAEGGTVQEGVDLAKDLALTTANAISIEQAAYKKPAQDPTMEALKTLAWATLGIVVVGGVVYSIYKFVPDKPRTSESERYSGSMVPALAAAEPKVVYELQTYIENPTESEMKEFDITGPGWLYYDHYDMKSIALRHKKELEKDGYKTRLIDRRS